MIKLLKNAQVYSPAPLGKKDVLVIGDKVARIDDSIQGYDGLPEVEVIDLKGKKLLPGYIDIHIHITGGGRNAQLLWGFTGGGKFTSEFPAHMMSHGARLAQDPDSRVVMHCHPSNLLAMTYVHDLDSRAFTRTLWRMCTEGILVFPDGVNVLPWMLCGTNEIGAATAERMAGARLVVWAQHGIYGAGRSLDETFGLIETAEKAAEIYLKIAHLPRLNTITDAQLRQLEQRYGVRARPGWLD